MTATQTTFTDVYEDILERLNITQSKMGSYTCEKICKVINQQQLRIAMTLMRKGDEFISTNTTANIVANQEVYSVGSGGDIDITNCLKIKQVLVRDVSRNIEQPLDFIKDRDRYKYLTVTNTNTATETLDVINAYLTTKVHTTGAMYPAIGLLPVPIAAETDGIRLYYYFKPRPITYNDDQVTNGGQTLDLPEEVVPLIGALCERRLLEKEGMAEKIALVAPRLMEERAEAESAVDHQQINNPDYIEYIGDPLVDY